MAYSLNSVNETTDLVPEDVLMQHRNGKGVLRDTYCMSPLVSAYSADNEFLGVARFGYSGIVLASKDGDMFWSKEIFNYLDSVKLVYQGTADELRVRSSLELSSAVKTDKYRFICTDSEPTGYYCLKDVKLVAPRGSIVALPLISADVVRFIGVALYSLKTNKILTLLDSTGAMSDKMVQTLLSVKSEVVNMKVIDGKIVIDLGNTVFDPYEVANVSAEKAAWLMLYPDSISVSSITNIEEPSKVHMFNAPPFRRSCIQISPETGSERLGITGLTYPSSVYCTIASNQMKKIICYPNTFGSIECHSDVGNLDFTAEQLRELTFLYFSSVNVNVKKYLTRLSCNGCSKGTIKVGNVKHADLSSGVYNISMQKCFVLDVFNSELEAEIGEIEDIKCSTGDNYTFKLGKCRSLSFNSHSLRIDIKADRIESLSLEKALNINLDIASCDSLNFGGKSLSYAGSREIDGTVDSLRQLRVANALSDLRGKLKLGANVVARDTAELILFISGFSNNKYGSFSDFIADAVDFLLHRAKFVWNIDLSMVEMSDVIFNLNVATSEKLNPALFLMIFVTLYSRLFFVGKPNARVTLNLGTTGECKLVRVNNIEAWLKSLCASQLDYICEIASSDVVSNFSFLKGITLQDSLEASCLLTLKHLRAGGLTGLYVPDYLYVEGCGDRYGN